MSIIKNILAIVVIFILASCGTSAPAATPTPIPTNSPPPTATPTPTDIPIYQNSFEGITNPAASGITSNGDVTLSTENFNYPGGGTALKIVGILPGEPISNLHVDFSIMKLIGEKSLDLTDKTIYYSAFIPADSTIDKISFFAGKGNQFILLAEVSADDYWKKGIWHEYHFDLSHAQGVLKDCDTIRIAGLRQSSGDQATAYFLVDDLKWIRSDSINIPVDDSIDSLRKYAANKNFIFGFYTQPNIIFGSEDDPFKNTRDDTKDPWYAYITAQEGVVNTVWDFLPAENENYSIFDYDRPEDAILIRQYNFGNANSMTSLGYEIGGWWFKGPEWLLNLDFPDTTKALMLYHIEKNMLYTKGQNPVWLLFNEFIQNISYGNTGLRNRNNPVGVDQWGEIECNHSLWAANATDASLIKAAFIKAREVDPSATLMVNDFDVEDIGWKKSEFLYSFVSNLKDDGIPIDGVGFQMHNFIDPSGKLVFFRKLIPWAYSNAQLVDLDTYLNNVDLNVKRYASVGLKVAFTEVEGQIKIDDIDLTSAAGRAEYEKRLHWQAKYFAGLLKIAMDNDNVIMFHMWGVTDRHQSFQPWPGFGNGFIFDKNYNPKPAYYAMLALLKGH